MLPSARTRAAVVAVVTLLGSLLLAVAPAGSAEAATDKGLVNGDIDVPAEGPPKVKMLWFTQNWKYLGTQGRQRRRLLAGLKPRAPTGSSSSTSGRRTTSTKYAPTDIKVTVRANAHDPAT